MPPLQVSAQAPQQWFSAAAGLQSVASELEGSPPDSAEESRVQKTVSGLEQYLLVAALESLVLG